jgi:hypothetical protein
VPAPPPTPPLTLPHPAPTPHPAPRPAPTHKVVDPDRKRFLMFYEAVAADGTRSIGVASSPDGRGKWARAPAPLLAPSGTPGAWDAGGVGAPCAVPMAAGRWRLYYAGRSAPGPGPWEGIGIALSQGDGGDPLAEPFKRRSGAAGVGAAP